MGRYTIFIYCKWLKANRKANKSVSLRYKKTVSLETVFTFNRAGLETRAAWGTWEWDHVTHVAHTCDVRD